MSYKGVQGYMNKINSLKLEVFIRMNKGVLKK